MAALAQGSWTPCPCSTSSSDTNRRTYNLTRPLQARPGCALKVTASSDPADPTKECFQPNHRHLHQKTLESSFFGDRLAADISELQHARGNSDIFLRQTSTSAWNQGSNVREEGGRGRGRGRGRGGGRGGGRGRGSTSQSGQRMKMYADERKDRRESRASGQLLPPGAFMMDDPVTGEKVLVWGIEDRPEIANPKPEELHWEPATIIGPGDYSDDWWWKVMEGDKYAPSAGYSVRGEPVNQEDEDFSADSDYETDSDDDDDVVQNGRKDDGGEDEADDEGEDYVPQPRNSRTRTIKLFGRDFGTKSSQKGDRKAESFEVVDTRDSLPLATPPPDSLFSAAPPPLVSVPAATPPPKESVSSATPPRIDTVPSATPSAGGAGRVLEWASPLTAEVLNAGSTRQVDEDITRERTNRARLAPAARVKGWEEDSEDDESTEIQASKLDVFKKGSDKLKARLQPSEQDRTGSGRRKEEREIKNLREQGFEGIVALDSDDEDSESDDEDGTSVMQRKSSLLDQLRLKALGEDLSDPSEHERDSASAGTRRLREEGGQVSIEEKVRAAVKASRERKNVDESLVADFFSSTSFKQAGASEEAVRALACVGAQRASHIQAMAYRAILGGKSCIVADQTGTGKTLAYLAPLLQRLREEELAGGGRAEPKRPHAVVLVPTSELAAQVLRVCRELASGGLPLRSAAVTGGFKLRTQVDALQSGLELLVATPGRLLQLLEAKSIVLDRVKSVVVDEADILFDDEGFAETLRPIRAAVPANAQFVHVTATLPEEVHKQLQHDYPGATSVLGPSLHLTASGLQEVLVDCSGGTDRSPESAFIRKKDALLQLVDQQPASKSIIFCNKIETCRKVENVLARHDRQGKRYTVLPYHAALNVEKRLESMQQFLESKPSQRLILVCTDRASRGVDSLDVEQVVLFDFPRDPSEYVRRVGRTARGAGGTGTCYVFALGRQVGLARKIMARNERNQPIHNVPNDFY